MNIIPHAPNRVAARDDRSTPIDAGWQMPLRQSDLKASLAGLYHFALQGTATEELAATLCRDLGRLLRAPLVLLGRRLETGGIAIEAASRESDLWLEFQRLPQRWDSGISSRGPAGEALRAGAPVHMTTADERFALWRNAALGDQVREAIAIPIGDSRILEIFCGSPLGEGARSGTVSLGQFAAQVDEFLADVADIKRRTLLAQALDAAGTGAFLTDLEGTIVWSNRAFTALSGYAADEVLGKKASILRSGEQGLRYYRDLWATIRSGRSWTGETVDRAKDGSHYVIQQTVSPIAPAGRTTHYLSIHQDIGRQHSARVKLELATRTDPGTGLLTAAAFATTAAQELQRAQAEGIPALLVVISLRGLRRIGATLDEELEAAVQQAMAERMRDGAAGTTGIHGQFEYVLLLTGEAASPAASAGTIERLSAALREPVPGLGQIPELDLHVGTARFPDEGATIHDLVHAADRRLANEPYRQARRIPAGDTP